MTQFYQVGGSVRDKLLGLPDKEIKDIDYVVTAGSFDLMIEAIKERGYTIFLTTPQYYTVRALIPTSRQVADFVWARKEGPYSDGRRPDWVKPATLEEDLARRDFTMNAIAMDEFGELIDPFNGIYDIRMSCIKCVGNPLERFTEDRLRQLRAVRFAITKAMALDSSIIEFLLNEPMSLEGVSIERTKDELFKMFRHDTSLTLDYIFAYRKLFTPIFSSSRLWLEPTLKER